MIADWCLWPIEGSRAAAAGGDVVRDAAHRVVGRRSVVACPFLLLGGGAACRAEATSADVIAGLHATLVDLGTEGTGAGRRGLERRLRPCVEATFDFVAMTRMAAGPAWRGLSVPEHE